MNAIPAFDMPRPDPLVHADAQAAQVDILGQRDLGAGTAVSDDDQPLLIWMAQGSMQLEVRAAGDNWAPALLKAGDFYLRTPQPCRQLRRSRQCRLSFQALRLRFCPALWARTLTELDHGASSGALRDVMGSADQTLGSLLQILLAGQRQPAAPCGNFVDGLAQAVAAHLLHACIGRERDLAAQHMGLPPYKLQRSLALMRERLAEPFDLQYLAAHAGLSVCHFSRSFKKATGLAPSRYFLGMRMDEARRMLREDRQSIIDVAMSLGYRSPSHFSQAFRWATGASPSTYRKGSASPGPQHARSLDGVSAGVGAIR